MLEALLHNLSLQTWHFLRDSPFHVREETVTETLLVEMSRSSEPVWIQKSTTSEEASDGMDWAMAVHHRNRWFVAYVQAKNLFGTQFGTYRDLRSPSSEEQARKLIRASNLDGALPLYAFFNKEVSPYIAGAVVDLGGCTMRTLNRGAGNPWTNNQSPLGVTLAHAQDVLDYVIPPPAANQRASSVNSYAMPWECLLCPGWRQNGGFGHPTRSRIADLAARLGRLEPTDDNQITFDEPPPWAQRVQQGLSVPAADLEAPSATYYVVLDDGGVVPDNVT